MKKWLDDLYAILIKRGFSTLDNVLKKYKSQIEDYEEIKLNDERIMLEPNDTITINIENRFHLYDRYVIFNRGYRGPRSFILYFYKYDNNSSFKYNTIQSAISNVLEIRDDTHNLYIKNISSENFLFDLYAKKLF